MYKTGDEIKIDWGITVKVGINQVLIFKFYDNEIEFWKDQDNKYHVGMVYFKNGEESRYKHYDLGKEPKKWISRVNKVKEIYNNLFPQIEFTNYVKVAGN